MRAVFLVLGSAFLFLAALGIVVPVLPTTPFVLLAAACYLRASTRLHDRLLRSRIFGPTIAAWHEHGAIPRRAKALAVVMVTVTFTISVVFVADPLIVRVALASIGVILVAWLWSRPSWTPSAVADEVGSG